MKKKYETRNKVVKWFTILVIVAFLVTLVGSWIVAFISTNPKKEAQKTQIIQTLNKPLEKETQEVNNQNQNPPALIETGN